MKTTRRLFTMTALCICVGLGSCGIPGIIVGGTITVSIFNNTDFEVDPAVEFGRSEPALRGLGVGILAPGELVEVDLNCDEAILLTTTNSTQLGFATDYVLDPLPLFEIDFDYFCGELVDFEFVGNGLDFDVFVDAGGENIY